MPLTVTVANGETRPITVTESKAQIQSPSRDCAAKWFTVSPYTGRQVVPAQGTATIPLTASLAARAPSACSARSATVTYQAKATLG